MGEFEKLFTPLNLGKAVLRNRIIMPAMLTGLAHPDGTVSEELLAYYRERAFGGAGMVIVESTSIEIPGRERYLRQLAIGSETFLPGLSELARTIHSGGSLAALQLCHQGRYAAPAITGTAPISPSPEPAQDYWPPSPAAKKPQIAEAIRLFARAASRAREAGFDAVELHGAHGYLISQFLSPLTNRRTDEYGGDLSSRSRFLEEVIRAVREAVGDDFPLILRLSADEMAEGGITLEDTIFFARRAELAGIDALHISAGTQLSKKPVSIAPMSFPPGFLAPYAERIRKDVSLPVITVGRINDPHLADGLLRQEKADFTAMGRALIADPELPAKAEAGEAGRIRKCLACNYCIEANIQRALPLRCTVNPRAGRESEFPLLPAFESRKVWIIGGGPAGMEAALTARARGHEVRLYERSSSLGGQLLEASKPPWKEAFHELVIHFRREMERAGVEVILGAEAPLAPRGERLPDAVIVATGSMPAIPDDLPGLDNLDHVTARQVLSGERETGRRVIVLGGERTGVEVAAFLAQEGKEVVLTRRKEKLALDMVPSVRKVFLDYLREREVEILTKVEYVEFRKDGLLIRRDGEERLIAADTVVLATGSTPVRDALEAWSGVGVKAIAIGDCVEPRDLASAIREGFETAYWL